MKIAVLMSTYNGEKYLDEQLESLSKQTVADKMTLYIRDDGSTDRTFDIIEKWKSKINIVLHKGKNVGPAMSFWELLMNQEIQADYYAFCDQDDVWDRDKIGRQIATLNNSIHLNCCNYRLSDANNKIIDARINISSPKFNMQDIIVTGSSQGCSMVFDDQFRTRILSLQIKYIPMHDFVIELYAVAFKCVSWVQDPLFSYRTHSNNVVYRNNRNINYYLSMYKKLRTNRNRNGIEFVCKEILDNCGNLLQEHDKNFLIVLSNYHKNMRNKIKVIRMLKHRDYSQKLLRSFEIKILVGIL